MKVQHGQVCVQIAETQRALAAAPLLRVPLVDLKAGILDFFAAAGDRYANDVIAPALASFGRNNYQGTAPDPDLVEKPLRFCDLERLVQAGSRDYSAQFATPSKAMFDDRALHALFAPLIKARVTTLLDAMSPADFGYNNIHPDKIGSDRVTRRAEIAALNTTLSNLTTSRNDHGHKLRALGLAEIHIRSIEQAANLPA